ncbi:hypothetical protein Ntsu_01460 [Nocardia sp. IFM 10818]
MRTPIVRAYAAVPVNLATVVRVGLHEFAAAFCDAVTGFTGGLIDLRGWAQELRRQAAKARADAGDAETTAAIVDKIVAETGESVQSTNSRVQVVLDGLPIKPYWETMNLTEESSVPRSMLATRAWNYSDTPKSGYNQYVYRYIWYYTQQGLPVYNDRIFYIQHAPAFQPLPNAMEGAFIRCRYSGGRKIVTYIPESVSGTPCELYVVVGRVLEGGDIRIEWVSENQTPLITVARAEQALELPEEIVFDVGETAFVGIHQCGGGSVRQLLGPTTTDLPRLATAWPPRPNFRFPTSAKLAVGASLAAGALDFASSGVPYVALSKKLIGNTAPKLVFYEDFDTGILPAAFAQMSSLPATVAGGVFVVAGGTDGVRRYLHAQRLNYDNHMVSGRVINPTARNAWLAVRSTPDHRKFVALTVIQSGLGLYQYNDGTWTGLAFGETPVASGDVVRLKAVGNIYTAQRRTGSGWTDVFAYTDTAGALPSGPGHRYTGLGNERMSWVNGGGWDYWKAEDL